MCLAQFMINGENMNVRIQSQDQVEQAAQALEEQAGQLANVTYTQTGNALSLYRANAVTFDNVIFQHGSNWKSGRLTNVTGAPVIL